VLLQTRQLSICDFEDAKRTKLNLTNLNNTGYFTFLYTKCNFRGSFVKTSVYNVRVRSIWRYTRLDVAHCCPYTPM